MPRLTAESLLAYKSPGPLSEDLDLPELGGDVHIEGVTTKAGREAIYADIRTLQGSNAGGNLGKALRLSFAPDDDDLTAAAWAAACVSEPKLTSAQWLQFCSEGYAVLGRIYVRCLACSRLIDDPNAPKEGDESAPDGVTAALNELKDAQATDPLASAGDCTATSTSSASRKK
jgi:hypothetical protein